MFLTVALAAAMSTGTSQGWNPEMDRWLKEGVDCVFRMEFTKAEEWSDKVIGALPDHPSGYFIKAGIAWTRYVYENDQSDQTLLATFDQKIEDVIAKAEKWLKLHPTDARALMTMGSAYGISSRLSVVRKEWLKAYRHGRRGVKLTREAAQADPTFTDANLGLGMYDYYSDLYPRFIGILAKLVLRGNRARGLETLKVVADKGYFTKSAAKILLVEIYTEDPFGARKPEEAVRIVKELRVEYPNSAMMHSSELVALYHADRVPEVVESGKDYLARVQKGVYNPLEAAKGNVILGTALWKLDRLDEAMAAFTTASEIKLNGKLSRWAVFALIRMGQLYDVQGQRELALAAYKKAAAEPDLWDFRQLAKAGISKPFKKEEGPGKITPA